MNHSDWSALLAAGRAGVAAEYVREHPLILAELEASAPTAGEGEPYGRRALHRDEAGEVLLMRWREDQFCAPHDHGISAGVIYLVRGRFVERNWRRVDGNLDLVSERTIEAPAWVPMEPQRIHDMKATGGGLGVHLYFPSISDMRVYDCARRQVLVVGDDDGAWIPSDERRVRSRTPFR